MTTLRPVLAASIAVLALAACAQSYEPIVDMKGVDQARYQQDLAECRTYAEKVSPAGEAATSGVIGDSGAPGASLLRIISFKPAKSSSIGLSSARVTVRYPAQ